MNNQNEPQASSGSQASGEGERVGWAEEGDSDAGLETLIVGSTEVSQPCFHVLV
jgi:hypothetical protein